MNVLILTTHLNTGGITSYILSLAQGLHKQGNKVFVASSGGNCQRLLESYGVQHIDLGFRTKSEADLRIYFNLGRVKRIIERENIDVIHAQTRVTQVMGFFLARLTHKPLITTCHGFFKPHFFRQMFSCWGEAVIAISRPVAVHLKNDFHVPLNKIALIPNGIDYAQFPQVTDQLKKQKRQEWGVQADLVLGVIARLSYVKGLDVLLASMKSVVEKYPQCLLMIVGEGPEYNNLKNQIIALKLEHHVRLERITNQTYEVLPLFDVFIMPSRQEGLGLSVMEAQACALPVIASHVGGLVDLIEEGRTGYLVPPDQAKTLADKIIEVLSHLPQAAQVGIAARAQIQEKFSLEKMVAATHKVYEQYSRR